MNVGSLFSGIGGIELGFERAGFSTEWFIEQDKYAQEILKKRFPEAKIYDDITQVNFSTIPKVSILTGGFPCQDISNAGKRVGIEGSRSSLWKHYLRAISTLRPEYAFIENVSALLGRGLDVVLSDLAKIGYDAEWHCVPASSTGALHRRDRIFIIAYPSCLRQFCSHLGEGRQDTNDEEQYPSKNKQEWEGWECESCKAGNNVSNTNKQRVERDDNKGLQDRISKQSNKSSKVLEDSKCNRDEQGDRQEVFSREKREEHSDKLERTGWWAVEPSVGRVADGVPNRVDRIKCLGNAVVPQVSEIFAKAIKKDAESGGKK